MNVRVYNTTTKKDIRIIPHVSKVVYDPYEYRDIEVYHSGGIDMVVLSLDERVEIMDDES